MLLGVNVDRAELSEENGVVTLGLYHTIDPAFYVLISKMVDSEESAVTRFEVSDQCNCAEIVNWRSFPQGLRIELTRGFGTLKGVKTVELHVTENCAQRTQEFFMNS